MRSRRHKRIGLNFYDKECNYARGIYEKIFTEGSQLEVKASPKPSQKKKPTLPLNIVEVPQQKIESSENDEGK